MNFPKTCRSRRPPNDITIEPKKAHLEDDMATQPGAMAFRSESGRCAAAESRSEKYEFVYADIDATRPRE
jgi:hypothetical protein